MSPILLKEAIKDRIVKIGKNIPVVLYGMSYKIEEHEILRSIRRLFMEYFIIFAQNWLHITCGVIRQFIDKGSEILGKDLRKKGRNLKQFSKEYIIDYLLRKGIN